MKNTSRLFLFGALALVLLTTACGGQQASPTPTAQATLPPIATDTPTAAASPTIATTITVTPAIPITGANAVSVQCQFCVNALAHALLLIPAGATFTILTPTATVSPSTNVNIECNSVETVEDRQVVLCHGEQNTPLLLNICEGDNCRQFAVQLQPCPPATLSAATPTPTTTGTTTPTPKSKTPTPTPTGSTPTNPAATSTVSGPTDTPTLTATPTFTATP